MQNINYISEKVKKMGELIGAPKEFLTVYAGPVGDGTPYVEIKGGKYFFVSSERGYEVFRKKATNEDEILYLVFKDVAWKMASDFELRNRVQGKDCRRVIFSKIIEIMSEVNAGWGNKVEKEINQTLERSPYKDK